MFSASLPLSDVTLWFSTHPRYSATPFRRKLPMTGNEFLDRPRRLAERRGYQFMYRPDRGKGSHGPVRFGDLRTVLPDPRRELKKGRCPACVGNSVYGLRTSTNSRNWMPSIA